MGKISKTQIIALFRILVERLIKVYWCSLSECLKSEIRSTKPACLPAGTKHPE